MHEHNAFGLADEVKCPVERRVAAAEDDDIFAFENGRILAAVMKLSALKLFNAFDNSTFSKSKFTTRFCVTPDAILVKKHKQNTNCIKNIFTILLLTFLSMERFLLKSIAINDRFGY